MGRSQAFDAAGDAVVAMVVPVGLGHGMVCHPTSAWFAGDDIAINALSRTCSALSLTGDVPAFVRVFLFVRQEYVLKALQGKTVILVTHQVEFLPAVDYILVRRQLQAVQCNNGVTMVAT